MPYADLTESDRLIIGDCLRAAADGPFFPDWEIHTLFGLEREALREISDAWPDVDHSCDDVDLAVNNSLVMLVGYPHRKQHIWSDWIRVPPNHLPPLLTKWRGNAPGSFFDAMK